MDFLKNILDAVFFVLPLFGGGFYLFLKALKEEKKRTEEYKHTHESIRAFVNFLYRREGGK